MIRTIKKPLKKCCECGDPVFSVHSMYCQVCARVAFRMKARRFSPQAQEAVWAYLRANGRRCYYSKIPLEMEDTKSPWFCVFDHVTPLDPNRIVVCCAMINEMKSALNEREFWFYVEQLADYIQTGKKIKKISLSCWRQSKLSTAQPKWKGKHKRCCLCGKEVFALRSKYCLRCSRFAHRLELQGFGKKVVADILNYVRVHGFRCFYTGIPLDMLNSRSPWYGVFNCVTPGDRSKVVLTCALFNEMKSDLTIKEFWYYIRQLANFRRHQTPIRKKNLIFWYRLNPPSVFSA